MAQESEQTFSSEQLRRKEGSMKLQCNTVRGLKCSV